MSNPIENMARRLTATLRHHGVEMHPDDINGLGQDAILALADAGYAVVPVEPTEDMLEVGAHCASSTPIPHTAERIYRAMIQAGRMTP